MSKRLLRLQGTAKETRLETNEAPIICSAIDTGWGYLRTNYACA